MRQLRMRQLTRAGLFTGVTLLTAAGAVACSGDGVAVPSVVTKYPVEASRLIQAAGLRVRYDSVPRIDAADFGVNGYNIERQSPAAGQHVRPGSTVTLTLTTSANAGMAPETQQQITASDVVGQDLNLALGTLARLGFLVDIPAAGPRDQLVVTRQSVPPGTTVPNGTHIVLTP